MTQMVASYACSMLWFILVSRGRGSSGYARGKVLNSDTNLHGVGKLPR